MNTQTNKLANTFTVAAVSIQKDTDVYLNVLKKKENVLFLSSVADNAANIGFTSTPPLSSEINLSIADRSTSLEANRIQNIEPTLVNGTNVFSISTDDFVITDIFTSAQNTSTVTPLFYKHVLSIDNVPRTDPNNEDFSLVSGVKLIDIQLLDQFFQPVRVFELQFDFTNGIIYSNLLSEYNSNNDFTVYYLKYVINNNGTINTFTEILDNEPVFRQAEFDDLDASLQLINDGRKTYLIEETSTDFDVTLPSSITEFAFQPLPSARIKLVKPPPQGANDEWFAQVTNGRFFTNVGGTLYKYRIAEFLTQVFNPEPPIKQITTEESTIISRTLVKVDRENIYQDDTLSLFVQLQINDSNDNGIAAFTTDDSIVGTIADNGKAYEKWSNTNKRGIRSVDHRTGIIDVEGLALQDSYTIETDYYYIAKHYEYTIINLNPLGNTDAITHRYTIFLDPELPQADHEQTLFFLKSDESGRVVESNWTTDNGGSFDNTTQLLDNGDELYIDIPDPAPSYVTGSITRFAQDLSTEGNGNILILGDLTTAEASSVDNINKIDTRLRGGGIKESLFQTTLNKQPEAQWYWDEGYWDGIPYPGNASYFVEVPVTLLNNVSGVWSPQQIRNVVEKYTAAGVYPIIKAYAPDITVSGIETTSDSITLKWLSHGS